MAYLKKIRLTIVVIIITLAFALFLYAMTGNGRYLIIPAGGVCVELFIYFAVRQRSKKLHRNSGGFVAN